jgi:hypothetical protein
MFDTGFAIQPREAFMNLATTILRTEMLAVAAKHRGAKPPK